MPEPEHPRTAHLAEPAGHLPPLRMPSGPYLADRVAALEATVEQMDATIGQLTLMMSLAAEALRPTGPPAGRR